MLKVYRVRPRQFLDGWWNTDGNTELRASGARLGFTSWLARNPVFLGSLSSENLPLGSVRGSHTVVPI